MKWTIIIAVLVVVIGVGGVVLSKSDIDFENVFPPMDTSKPH